MLRTVVSAVAILFVAGAVVITVINPFEWPVLAAALLIAFGCLFERRYHARETGVPDARFRPTDERFVDPETGRSMTVWADPSTGERRYAEDREAPFSRGGA